MRIIIALMAVAFLAGCTTANEAVKAAAAKNVNASGLLSVQNIQTGYDPVTGSVTPKVLLVTGSLNYRSNVVSVPEGSTVPDAAEYSREESSSIWNAEAKSVNVRWSFTASTPEQADARMKALLDYDAQQGR
ncbi:hypothetical protein [Victivallis vadensis]|uniref:hypothetical protein n=1 Tax=Victivallis vadensis TaxID=172901 RepID=UPI0023F65249|nr:hypothetical protein [Victivallis vadensis]